MQVVENVALISINATLLVQLMSFLVFMMLFNRIMIRPLRQVMAERKDYIVQARQKIRAIDQSYEEISKQIKTQEFEARQAAYDIRDQIEETGQQSAHELITKTKQEIRDLRLTGQKETQAQVAQARKTIAAEADVLANQLIAAILDRRRLL